MNAFFLVSCARSGSTAMARILDTAANGACVIEPAPTLAVESRLAMEGRLADPRRVVDETVVPRVRAGQRTAGIYGEKNVTYGPFIGDLHQATGARFVLLVRDGRDVVRSLVDWHDRVFGTIYRECADAGQLAPRALAAAAALPVHHDASDFGRPRPAAGTALAEQWETMSRADMSAYYWSTINDLHLDALERLPADAWMSVDFTRPAIDDVLRAADFLGLRGIERAAVEGMLAQRINSLEDRVGEPEAHPSWPHWSGAERRRFESLAGDTMRRLGCFTDDATRWRPPGYGACWRRRPADVDWYIWMHDGRRAVHDDTVAWIRSHEPVESVADFGCGLGVGYAEALHDRRYVGFDLVDESIAWCRTNRRHPRHEYHHLDFVTGPTPDRYDLVMSSGTIDNTWDVEAYLDAMIRASRGWIYVTSYRGWFPGLDDHRYLWSDTDLCFYNDLSPPRVRAHLASRGCREIVVEPFHEETRITARVAS